MRILQIIQSKQLRGAEIFACQLAAEVIKLNEVVDVVYLFEKDPPHLKFDLNFIFLGGQQKRRLFDYYGYLRLARLIKENDYDLVQANAGDTLKYAAFSKLLFRWKARIVFRNANQMSRFIKGRLHRAFNKFLLSRCDFFISVSENCRQDLIRLYPRAFSYSRTIPIGTYNFDDVPSIQSTKHGIVFINISTFVAEKNHSFLVDTFAEFCRRNKAGYLWLVGGGKLLETVRAQVGRAGISERVKFWGYRSDVISILKSADLMLMPSKIEGLPGAILESLSCGKPVIAAAVGGIPEVIKDGINGYCIVNEEIGQYIRKMELLVANPVLRDQLAYGGKTTVALEFRMDAIALRFRNAYLELMGMKT